MKFKLLWERIGQSTTYCPYLVWEWAYSLVETHIKRAYFVETDIHHRNPKRKRMSQEMFDTDMQICFENESELNFLLSNIFLLERDHIVIAPKIYEILCCATHWSTWHLCCVTRLSTRHSGLWQEVACWFQSWKNSAGFVWRV